MLAARRGDSGALKMPVAMLKCLDGGCLLRGAPAKNSAVGACFLGFLFISKIVWLPHGALFDPTYKERVEVIGTNQRSLEDAGDRPSHPYPQQKS